MVILQKMHLRRIAVKPWHGGRPLKRLSLHDDLLGTLPHRETGNIGGQGHADLIGPRAPQVRYSGLEPLGVSGNGLRAGRGTLAVPVPGPPRVPSAPTGITSRYVAITKSRIPVLAAISRHAVGGRTVPVPGSTGHGGFSGNVMLVKEIPANADHGKHSG